MYAQMAKVVNSALSDLIYSLSKQGERDGRYQTGTEAIRQFTELVV